MAISVVTINQKITAYIMNLVIRLVNRQGTTLMIPTSVAGTGVSLATTGKVTFTTATSVSVNGCFTSEFESYRIIIDISATSTSLGGGIRLRASGTDASGSGTYVGRTSYGTGTTWATVTYGSGSTSFPYAAISATDHFIIIDINAPFLARATRAQIVGSGFTGTGTGAGTADSFINGKHTTASSYDGFSIIPSTGNITGSLTVYGYNAGV